MELFHFGHTTKSLYAKEQGISLERLVVDREFKNDHRQGLTECYERLVKENKYFEVEAVAAALRRSRATLLIVVDMRMRYELAYFDGNIPKRWHLRIRSSKSSALRRGVWKKHAVDSGVTENDLDSITPDEWFENDEDGFRKIDELFLRLVDRVRFAGSSKRSPLSLIRLRKPLVVSVESIIGAGKSTLLRMLARLKSERVDIVNVVEEPVEQWGPVLSAYYAEPHGNALSLQLWVTATRLMAVRKAMRRAGLYSGSRVPIILLERSYLSDVQVFGRVRCEKAQLSDAQLRMLLDFAEDQVAADASVPAIDAVLHLDCPVNIAAERVRARDRDVEKSGVPEDYQQQLAVAHEAWLRGCTLPVLRLDVGADFERDSDLFARYCADIGEFVAGIA